MKFYLLSLYLAVPVALLCACGPKETQPVFSSSDLSGSASQFVQSSASLGEFSSPQSQPAQAACAQAWLEGYSPELSNLGQSMDQILLESDLVSYDWWPGGREGVRMDLTPLLFSGPPRQSGSVCAALGTTLRQETTVDVLRSQWEDTLIFAPNDPVAGACWMVQAGEITFRFLTDSQGRSLRSGGSNLVLSRDDLLPKTLFPQWADGLASWIDQWTEQPGPVWDKLISSSAALGQTGTPAGAVQPGDADLADLLYAGFGVKDPSTGIQFFSSEEGQPWEAITVPAALILGDALPADTDQIISSLNTAFSWSLYNGAGYWFYLGNYKVFLPSDAQGLVSPDSDFLIHWGDNAGA
ncbi:MAG: hypothetical protein VB071_09370 [Lawsonibacter sp.]|nr:hypothetical protein [Lawsonibacter sp.]